MPKLSSRYGKNSTGALRYVLSSGFGTLTNSAAEVTLFDQAVSGAASGKVLTVSTGGIFLNNSPSAKSLRVRLYLDNSPNPVFDLTTATLASSVASTGWAFDYAATLNSTGADPGRGCILVTTSLGTAAGGPKAGAAVSTLTRVKLTVLLSGAANAATNVTASNAVITIS